jgi:hypothetical protein
MVFPTYTNALFVRCNPIHPFHSLHNTLLCQMHFKISVSTIPLLTLGAQEQT